MKYHVLVVEDEVALLRGLVRGLSSVPSLHVSGKATVEEALEVLHNDPPDLLITDLNLAGRSGIELLDALNQRALRIAVIVMTAYRIAFSSQLSKHPSLIVLEKPVGLQDLRRVIEEALSRHAGPTPIGPFQLSDFLQMAGLGRHSLQIHVELRDQTRGTLEIVDGQVWNALCGERTGLDALAWMMHSPIQRLGHSALPLAPKHREIHQHWEEILIDLARINDEKKRDTDDIGSLFSHASLELPEWSSREISAVEAEASLPPQPSLPSDASLPLLQTPLPPSLSSPIDDLLFQLIEALAAHDTPRASSLLQQARTLHPHDERLHFRWLRSLLASPLSQA